MQTRITIDLQNPQLLQTLKTQATQDHKLVREIVIEALNLYLSSRNENQALAKLAEPSFAEWDNSQDSDYDHL